MLYRTLGRTGERVSAIGLGGWHIGFKKHSDAESITIIRTAIECLHYALNLPTSVVITGIDSLAILDQALDAIRTFVPMDKEQVKALLAKTVKAASRGEFELFKTTSIFDATATNPAWLGEEPERIQRLVPAG